MKLNDLILLFLPFLKRLIITYWIITLASIRQLFLLWFIEVLKKPHQWSVMRTFNFKEIDELVYGPMGIIIFNFFFYRGE